MSSYWAGYSGTGLVLTESEFNAMLEVYKEKNPEHADIDEHLDDYGFDETPFIKSEFAGVVIRGLYEDTAQHACMLTYLCELRDDDVDGLTFWPFYNPDGRININEQKENGDWKCAEYTHPIWESKASECYVCWSDKDMCSVKAFDQKPYESYDAFVQEFKNKFGAYLPEDFDWNAHLGYMSYACYA